MNKLTLNNLLSLMRILCITLILLPAFSLTANAASVDVSGSKLTVHNDGSFTLTIKGVTDIPMPAGGLIQLVPAGVYWDFYPTTISTATAPVEMYMPSLSSMMVKFSSAYTIPAAGGMQITFSNADIMPGNTLPTEANLQLMDASWTTIADATIPIMPEGSVGGAVSLVLSVSANSFSPDWEGNLAAPATVTVIAKNTANQTDTTVNGKAALYTENGPITMLNSQTYLYVNMVNGAGTATVNKLTDISAQSSPYTVGLKAAMPLYDAVSNPVTLNITPNPLSVTGTVLDETGANMQVATVWLQTADGYIASRTVTGADGRFKLYGSPKSASYRVIAVKGDLYGEVTRDLSTQNTATITLYSQIKVTVNFYRNKATLDGTPNQNIISPANLYSAGSYRVEAYSDANGSNPITPVKTDGRDVYIQISDLMNGGGKLFIKAIPRSADADPFIDSSSVLTEVNYAAAPDANNINLDLAERPVGTITVKNTGTQYPMTVSFESGDNKQKYKEIEIQPGGMCNYTPPEGYQTTANPVQVFISGYKADKWYVPRDRYLALVSMGRKAEFAMSTADLIYTRPDLTRSGTITSKQYGDIISLSYSNFGNWGEKYSFDLSPGLELPPNWKDYISFTVCGLSRKYTAEQVHATYDPVKHNISYTYDEPYGKYAGEIHPVQFWWDLRETSGVKRNYDSVFTFAVKAKESTANTVSHRIVLRYHGVYVVNVVSYDPPYNAISEFDDHGLGEDGITSKTYSFVTGHPLTLEGPNTTTNDKVFVQGTARPNAAVAIHVNGALKANLTANAVGRYSGSVTLPGAENGKSYKLTAKLDSKTSNELMVRCSKRLLYTKELWMNSKQAGMFEKEYLLINNSVSYENGAPVIKDAQQGKTQNIMLGDQVKFRVKMSDNSAVQKVFVSADTGSGALFSIPCIYNASSGYWESETQTNMNWNGSSNIRNYRVTYVLNIGYEYMSPAELDANLRESQAAMVAYTPPERMFTDPETYAAELQQAMLESAPVELRNATYTSVGGGVTRMSIPLGNGQNADVDVSAVDITDAELTALGAKAKTNGIPLGGGAYYKEINYVCTLNGGGTKAYTEKAFNDALYAERLKHLYESSAQILNRLNIASVRVETTQYLHLTRNAAQQAQAQPFMRAMADGPFLGETLEGVRSYLDLAAGSLGAVMDSPWWQVAANTPMGQAVGAVSGYIGAATAILGLPDKFITTSNTRDVANAYESLFNNMKDMQYTECYNHLQPEQKTAYYNLMQSMQGGMYQASRLKMNTYVNTAGSVLSAIGSVYMAVKGGSVASVGQKAAISSISWLSNMYGGFTDYDENVKQQLEMYKNAYEQTQFLSDAFKREAALACGYKEADKTQGNYNFIHDPSGIVYDGTLDYPVAGVRAEIWTAADANGTNARLWSEAADYDQINPQITDVDGMFQWFTPEGWWQVRIFNNTTNAELKRSEWLKVLPPHFDVNLNIGGEPFTIKYDGNGGGLPLSDIINPDAFDMQNFPQTIFMIPPGKDHTVIENVFVRNDSIFTAWNTKADGSGTTYQPDAVISNIQADITLYAQWVYSPNGIPTVTEADNSIVVYPNPTKGELRIISKGINPLVKVALFDVFGKKLSTFNFQLSTESIDVSALPQGIYFLKIETDKGIETAKFVKE